MTQLKKKNSRSITMQSIGHAIGSFLNESYLHGLKYLGPSHHWATKLCWSFVLISALSLVALLISDGFTDWKNYPVLTSVESIDSPLNDIQFPTITVCHEDYFKPDEWALTEAVFNMLEVPEDDEFNQDLSKLLFDLVEKKLDTVKIEGYSFYEQRLDSTFKAIQDGKISLIDLENDLKAVAMNLSSSVQFYNYLEGKYNFSSYNSNFECNESCKEAKRKIEDLFLVSEIVTIKSDIGLGTRLRQLASHLGKTFDLEQVSKGKTRHFDDVCFDINGLERKIHEVMQSLGQKYGSNVSLHDMPNLYRVSTIWFIVKELRKQQPFFTFCSNDIKSDKKIGRYDQLPFCPQSWYSGKNMVKNPYLDSTNPDFCRGGTSNLTGTNLEAIFMAMKFAYHMIDETDFENIRKTLQEINLPFKISSTLDLESKSFQALVRNYASIVEDEDGFSPVITSRGLCYAWNGNPMSTLFKSSKYIKNFKQVFSKEMTEDIKKGILWKQTLILDHHSLYQDDRMSNKNGMFFIGINSKDTFFDMFSASVIRNGYKTLISVKPTTVETNKDLENDLDVRSRGCRFRNEVPENMTILSKYSLAGCKFECMIKYSYNQCKCLPWDIYRTDNDYSKELCDSAGNDCFWRKMNDYNYLGTECFCWPACDSVKFSLSKEQIPIDYMEECDGTNAGVSYTINKLSFAVPMFTKLLNTINDTIEWKYLKVPLNYYKDQCKIHHKKDIAVVEIQMEGHTFMKMRQSLRTTLADKIGSIGGTLGLFCGFSILALFEVVHWIGKILHDIFAPKKPRF